LKTKTIFFCKECGAQSPKWLGKCPACGNWNTYEEENVQVSSNKSVLTLPKKEKTKPKLLSGINLQEQTRIDTGNNEFNRVLGGGLVPGTIILIGGEPGIGKSTLALQIALKATNLKTLYISGEESEQQIKLRALRINKNSDNCLILNESSLENIVFHAIEIKPDLLVIDSIQTMQTEKVDSSPGTVTQIRECTNELLKLAKTYSIPTILIGHITKDGSLAGPKLLEHMVDTVLQFEGDRNHIYRIIRAVKNRFGSTSELGIFEMQQSGLREVPNPSELLLSQNEEDMSGVAISASVEGIRPFLIEVQALVSSAVYGTPQRSSTGFDLRRLNMLLAVLEKRAGFRLAQKDVFLNIAGGIKVDDPAIDLAVICAILSSDQDLSIDRTKCFAGEVGLTGEIRPVTRIEQRIIEAEKLGFTEIFISKHNKIQSLQNKFKIKISLAAKVDEVFKAMFG
jgi:DNA repair protein RadA/Sms